MCVKNEVVDVVELLVLVVEVELVVVVLLVEVVVVVVEVAGVVVAGLECLGRLCQAPAAGRTGPCSGSWSTVGRGYHDRLLARVGHRR